MKKHQSGYLNADIYEIRYIKISIKQRLPFQGPIPPIRGKCPEGTKGVGMLSPKVTERLLQICGDLSVSASPSHLPWEGRPWGTHSNGFPYEGKLSPEATDEVGAAA